MPAVVVFHLFCGLSHSEIPIITISMSNKLCQILITNECLTSVLFSLQRLDDLFSGSTKKIWNIQRKICNWREIVSTIQSFDLFFWMRIFTCSPAQTHEYYSEIFQIFFADPLNKSSRRWSENKTDVRDSLVPLFEVILHFVWPNIHARQRVKSNCSLWSLPYKLHIYHV
jgi:hypothetical protein